MKLFTGVAQRWYKQRVLYMYKAKPTCGFVTTVNHLACLCPTCKDTQFKRSKKFKTYLLPYDRLYVFLCSVKNPLQKLHFLQTRFSDIRTNVEFPVPILRFQNSVHVPEFIDMSTKTVIDFLPPDTISTSRTIKAARRELTPYGYSYVVFSQDFKTVYEAPSYAEARLKSIHHTLGRLLGVA